jgi:hypothetical protein
MNKETIRSKLHTSMVERAVSKIEAGKNDFPAYPTLGRIAVGLVVGIGEKSDPFYNQVNQAIVESKLSQVYAVRSETGSGLTDGRTRVRANVAPIKDRTDGKVILRAISPRTQTE